MASCAAWTSFGHWDLPGKHRLEVSRYGILVVTIKRDTKTLSLEGGRYEIL